MEIKKQSEFKINHKPKPSGNTINTPNGKRTFKPVSASRKTALNTIIKDLNSGHGSFGDMIAHWRKFSHISNDHKNPWQFLPFEYRGTSLQKVDQLINQFSQKTFLNDQELLSDTIKLKKEAKRHLNENGKRKAAISALIQKCDKIIIELKESDSNKKVTLEQIDHDLTQNNGTLVKEWLDSNIEITDLSNHQERSKLAEVINQKISDGTLTARQGLHLLKKAATGDAFYQIASTVICNQTQGDITKLPVIFEQCHEVIDATLIEETTLATIQTYFSEILDASLTKLDELLNSNPATALTIAKTLEVHIQHGSLDAILLEIPSFIGASGPVSTDELNAFKQSPDRVAELANQICKSPNNYNVIFNHLQDDSAIGSTILKADIRGAIKQTKNDTVQQTVQLLEHIEAEKLSKLEALHNEKSTISDRLDDATLTTEDKNTLTSKKAKLEEQIQLIERGSFQGEVAKLSPEIIKQISNLSRRNYAQRIDEIKPILDALDLPPVISDIFESSALAMLSRSAHIDDINSDINSTNAKLFESDISTNEMLAQNLRQNLYTIDLRTPDGSIESSRYSPTNLNAFNILKTLVAIDSSIANKDEALTDLRALCFSTDIDTTKGLNHLPVFFETHLPDDSLTRKTLELLSSKYVSATCHHVTHDFSEELPSMPFEDAKTRRLILDINPENPTKVSLTHRLHFKVMDDEFKTDELNLEAKQQISLTKDAPPVTHFRLKTCTSKKQRTENDKLTKKIEAFNGIVLITPQLTKPLPPLETTLTNAAPELLPLYNKLLQSSALQQRISVLTELIEAVEKLPQKDCFKCLNELEIITCKINSDIHKLETKGRFKGINMANLFTSQSIFNSKQFSKHLSHAKSLLSSIHTLRYRGTKTEKSDNPYTIIEGAQGNRYELLTHLTQSEADEFGIGKFYDEEREKILVGGGRSKKIRLARNTETGEILIVGKSIIFNNEVKEAFEREVENHLSLNQTSVLKLEDHAIFEIDDDIQKGYTFMSLGKECGDKTILRLKELPYGEKIKQTSQLNIDLIRGIKEFETKGFIHGDIKPQNFVISDKNTAHWIDFGTGINKGAIEINSPTDLSNIPNTPKYLAPDLHKSGIDLFSQTDSLTKKDAWALGITLYELWTGNTPFNLDTVSLKEIPDSIKRTPLDTNAIPAPFNEVIHGLLTINPNERWSAHQALSYLVPQLPKH